MLYRRPVLLVEYLSILGSKKEPYFSKTVGVAFQNIHLIDSITVKLGGGHTTYLGKLLFKLDYNNYVLQLEQGQLAVFWLHGSLRMKK